MEIVPSININNNNNNIGIIKFNNPNFNEEDKLKPSDFLSKFKFYDSKRSNPLMTKYEKARIIGKRAQQISENSVIMVDLEGEDDPIDIAKKEIKQNKIKIIVRRYLPDGVEEDWSIDEMDHYE